MKTLFILMWFVLLGIPGNTVAQTNVLDVYIAEGMKNNLVLKQKNISLDKALLALQAAKSMYQPSVAFQANYSTATGGRNIALPLGDLLNPVYATLNQLTGSSQFPMLENQSINFLPTNYYDARIRTTVPIINTDIIYNKRINEQQVTLQEFEVQTYERELVKDIKSAYFNYLNAQQAVSIYQSALSLAKESRRVNERLLANGQGLHAYVLRSESEIEQVEAQVTQAEQQRENARLYFNALLNRDGESSIDTLKDVAHSLLMASSMLREGGGITGREELKSLQEVIDINENMVKMNRKFTIPKMNGFLDVGSQAEELRFNNQSRYLMLGLQFDLPIYSGNRNRTKVKQSMLELEEAVLNKAHITRQLTVSSGVARNNLEAAWSTYRSSLKQLEAAASYQRLIDKGYQAGTNTYIETIDARNQLTSARLSTEVNKYNVLLAAAELEREYATYPLKETENE
ncbi:TolC family protein [Olivibacter sp. SDN3]|uniref:TolC family protein n=1 Tax=Olivibacter sp. SDN3 TaxID=2764720 RepID=UPI0016510906|nr:TolC family protein [Olivibacter sp. SDN3]QNL49856.1 TolC family protein [Olivibacter sp. SDN3]